VSEPRRRSVGEAKKRKKKKKKKTPLGHWSPASLTGINVRHMSDTGTLPKMACRCNLGFNTMHKYIMLTELSAH